MSTIPPVAGASKLGEAFWLKFLEICDRHGWDPKAIVAVMLNESGLDPTAGLSAWTPTRTASGLIQFIESTARGLGVPRTDVAPNATLQERGQGKSWATWTILQMPAIDQLDLVEAYYSRFTGLSRPVDYYLATWGSGGGRPMSDVLSSKGEKAYDANVVLDADKDGKITVADLNTFIMRRYPESWDPKALPAPAVASAPPRGAGSSFSSPRLLPLEYGPQLARREDAPEPKPTRTWIQRLLDRLMGLR